MTGLITYYPTYSLPKWTYLGSRSNQQALRMTGQVSSRCTVGTSGAGVGVECLRFWVQGSGLWGWGESVRVQGWGLRFIMLFQMGSFPCKPA